LLRNKHQAYNNPLAQGWAISDPRTTCGPPKISLNLKIFEKRVR